MSGGLHTLSSEKTTTSFFQTMSLLARAPRLAARSARSNVRVQSRGMHGEGEYKVCSSQRNPRYPAGKFKYMLQHIPFDYDKKLPLAIKTFLYLGTGFSIPFVASYYQL